MAATINVKIAHSGKYWVRSQKSELRKLYMAQFGEDSALAKNASKKLWDHLDAVVWSPDNLFQVVANGLVDISIPANQKKICRLLQDNESISYGFHHVLVENNPNPQFPLHITEDVDLQLDMGTLASKLSNAKFTVGVALAEWLKNPDFVSVLFKQAPNFIERFTSAQLKDYAFRSPAFAAELCKSAQFSEIFLSEIPSENELLVLLGNVHLTPDQFYAIFKFAYTSTEKNNLKACLWGILDDVVSETERDISDDRKLLCANVRKHIFSGEKNPVLANMIARDGELLNLLSGRFSGPRLKQLLSLHPSKVTFFENIVGFSPKSLKTLGIPLLTLMADSLDKGQQKRLRRLLNKHVSVHEPLSTEKVTVSIKSLLQHQLQYYLTLYKSGSSEHSKCYGKFLIPVLKNPLLYGQLNISATQLSDILNQKFHDKSIEFIISQDPLLYSKLMLHPAWAKAAENNEIPDTHQHLKAKVQLGQYQRGGLYNAIFEIPDKKTSPHIAFIIATNDALWIQLNPWIYVWFLHLCDIVSFQYFHDYFVSHQDNLSSKSFIFSIRQRWNGLGHFKDFLKKVICQEGMNSSDEQEISFLADLFSGEELSQILNSGPKDNITVSSDDEEDNEDVVLQIDKVFRAELRNKLPSAIEDSPYTRDRYLQALISADAIDRDDPILSSDITKHNLTRLNVVQMLISDKAAVREWVTSILIADPGLLIRLLKTNTKTNDPYEISIREYLPQLFTVFDNLFEPCGLANELDGKGLCLYLSLGAMPSAVDTNQTVSAAFKRNPQLVGKLISYLYSVFQEPSGWESDHIDPKVGSLLEGILLDSAVKEALLASTSLFNISHLTQFSKMWPSAFATVVSADDAFYRNIVFAQPGHSEFIQQVFEQGASYGIRLYGENLGWTVPGMLADARTRPYILYSEEGRAEVTAPVLLECLNSGEKAYEKIFAQHPELLVKLMFDEGCRDQILPVGWTAITILLEKESALRMIASMNISPSMCYWMLQSQNTMLKDFVVEMLKRNLQQGNLELLMQLILHPNLSNITPMIVDLIASVQDSPEFLSSLSEGSSEKLLKLFHALPVVASRLCQHQPAVALKLLSIAIEKKGLADQVLRYHPDILVCALSDDTFAKKKFSSAELKYLFSMNNKRVISVLVSQPAIMLEAMRKPLALTQNHYNVILSQMITGETKYLWNNSNQLTGDFKDLRFFLQSYVNRLIMNNTPENYPMLRVFLADPFFLNQFVPTFNAEVLGMIYREKLDSSGQLFSQATKKYNPEAFSKFVCENIQHFTALELNTLAEEKELLNQVASAITTQQFQSLLMSDAFKSAENFSTVFKEICVKQRSSQHITHNFDGTKIVLSEVAHEGLSVGLPTKRPKPSSLLNVKNRDSWTLPEYITQKNEECRQRHASVEKTFNVLASNLLKKFSFAVEAEQEKPRDFLARVLTESHQADGWDFMRAFVIASDDTFWYTIRPSEMVSLLDHVKIAGKKMTSNQSEKIKNLIKASPIFALKLAYNPKKSTEESVVVHADTSIQQKSGPEFVKKLILGICQDPEYYSQRLNQHPQWKKDCVDLLTYMIPVDHDTFPALCSLFSGIDANALPEISTLFIGDQGFRHLMLRYFARHYSLSVLLNAKLDNTLSGMVKVFWAAFKHRDEAISVILNEADAGTLCHLLYLCHDPANLANYQEEVAHYFSQNLLLISRLLHYGSPEFWQHVLQFPNNFLMRFLASSSFHNPAFDVSEMICVLNIKHPEVTIQYLSALEKKSSDFGLRLIELSEFMTPEVRAFTFSAMTASQRTQVIQKIRQNYSIRIDLLYGLITLGDPEICATIIQSRVSVTVDLLKILDSDVEKKIPLIAVKKSIIDLLGSSFAVVLKRHYFYLSRLILEGDQEIWTHLSLAASQSYDISKVVCLIALQQLPDHRKIVEPFLSRFFKVSKSRKFYSELNFEVVSELLSWENPTITRELLSKSDVLKLLINNQYTLSQSMLEVVFNNAVNDDDLSTGIRNLNLLLNKSYCSGNALSLALIFDAKIATLQRASKALQRAEGRGSDNVEKISEKILNLSLCCLDDQIRNHIFCHINKDTWVSFINAGDERVIDQFFCDLRQNSDQYHAGIHSVLTECLDKITSKYFFERLYSYPRLCQIAFPKLTENPEFISAFGDFVGYVDCIKPDEASFAIRCLDSIPVTGWHPLLEFSKNPTYESETLGFAFIKPLEGVKELVKHSAIVSRQQRLKSHAVREIDQSLHIN